VQIPLVLGVLQERLEVAPAKPHVRVSPALALRQRALGLHALEAVLCGAQDGKSLTAADGEAVEVLRRKCDATFSFPQVMRNLRCRTTANLRSRCTSLSARS
jgi:hypothetical protein